MQDITIYTTSYCGYCMQAKSLCKRLGLPFQEISLDDQDDLRERLSKENGGWRTVPMIFIGGKFVGGYEDIMLLHQQGKLKARVEGES